MCWNHQRCCGTANGHSQGSTKQSWVGTFQKFVQFQVKMQTFPVENSKVIRTFINTAKNDGFFRGLYAGAVPSLVANVGENAVLFVAYGQCQKVIAKLGGYPKPEDMHPLGNAISGKIEILHSRHSRKTFNYRFLGCCVFFTNFVPN